MTPAGGATPGARAALRARWSAGTLGRRVARVDLRLYTLIRRDLHAPRLVGPARAYATLGEHAGVWLALGALGFALDGSRRSAWGRAAVSVATAHALNTGVKLAIARPRPRFEGLPALAGTPSGLSFPSAHASSSFAAARAYGPLIGHRTLYGAATAMALSRVYLGVHYPSDIVAGAALGTVVGTLGRDR